MELTLAYSYSNNLTSYCFISNNLINLSSLSNASKVMLVVSSEVSKYIQIVQVD